MSESKSFCPSSDHTRITSTRAVRSSYHSPRTTQQLAASTKVETTTMSPKPKGMVESEYAPEELKEALQSLLKDSHDPDYDARHIFGYGDADHELSMLQIITATRILDYRAIMVRGVVIFVFRCCLVIG